MIKNTKHLTERFGPEFERLKAQLETTYSGNAYVLGHVARFATSIVMLGDLIRPGFKVLEIGWSNLLHRYIAADVACWDYTSFERDSPSQSAGALHIGPGEGRTVPTQNFRLNLETDPFPVQSDEYDLVICGEVIEHMDIDPMFVIAEINRISRPGGALFVTTPNASSARVVFKAVNGYHPSFFMQYARNASPYRHNFEYTPPLLQSLISAGGYKVQSLETLDTFEDPFPEGYEILKKLGAPMTARGDNIFLVGIKEEGIRERYPAGIYA
jgi:SAM-dependent methyltransferase